MRLSLCDHEDWVDLFVRTTILFVISIEAEITQRFCLLKGALLCCL